MIHYLFNVMHVWEASLLRRVATSLSHLNIKIWAEYGAMYAIVQTTSLTTNLVKLPLLQLLSWRARITYN